MTPQEIIDVVTAFRDGKKVESRHKSSTPDGRWHLEARFEWDFMQRDYRVTREPRRVWAFLCEFQTNQQVKLYTCKPSHLGETIEFVEVMK